MNRLDDVHRGIPPDRAVQAGRARRSSTSRAASSCPGTSSCKNITFGYSPLDPPLIEDFNLVVEPGRRVALVGAQRQRQVDRREGRSRACTSPGAARCCSTACRATRLPRDLLVNSLAVVDQEVFLFGGTVAENITMWDPTMPVPRVGTAGRDAAIDEVIEAREGGYQSVGAGRRRQLQRRAVPAPRDRAGARRRADDRDPRRGDERARPDDRDAHRREHAPARLHVHHHRAPAEHDPRRRRDHRPGARARSCSAARTTR